MANDLNQIAPTAAPSAPTTALIYDDWYPALRTDTLRKGKEQFRVKASWEPGPKDRVAAPPRDDGRRNEIRERHRHPHEHPRQQPPRSPSPRR